LIKDSQPKCPEFSGLETKGKETSKMVVRRAKVPKEGKGDCPRESGFFTTVVDGGRRP